MVISDFLHAREKIAMAANALIDQVLSVFKVLIASIFLNLRTLERREIPVRQKSTK